MNLLFTSKILDYENEVLLNLAPFKDDRSMS